MPLLTCAVLHHYQLILGMLLINLQCEYGSFQQIDVQLTLSQSDWLQQLIELPFSIKEKAMEFSSYSQYNAQSSLYLSTIYTQVDQSAWFFS
jgi:hypothetical protein